MHDNPATNPPNKPIPLSPRQSFTYESDHNRRLYHRHQFRLLLAWLSTWGQVEINCLYSMMAALRGPDTQFYTRQPLCGFRSSEDLKNYFTKPLRALFWAYTPLDNPSGITVPRYPTLPSPSTIDTLDYNEIYYKAIEVQKTILGLTEQPNLSHYMDHVVTALRAARNMGLIDNQGRLIHQPIAYVPPPKP